MLLEAKASSFQQDRTNNTVRKRQKCSGGCYCETSSSNHQPHDNNNGHQHPNDGTGILPRPTDDLGSYFSAEYLSVQCQSSSRVLETAAALARSRVWRSDFYAKIFFGYRILHHLFPFMDGSSNARCCIERSILYVHTARLKVQLLRFC